MADLIRPEPAQTPEDSWGGLWVWTQGIARRTLKAVFLVGVFLFFVYLHEKLNVAAEHVLKDAPDLLRVAQVGYTVGFVVAYVKLVYEMVDTFVPVGATVRAAWEKWGKR